MSVRADVVEGAWRRQRQWSIAASNGRERLERWRRVNLILLVVGAILGAVAAHASWPRGVTGTAAGGAALALAVAGILQQRFLNADEVARWTGARAASETLKAEVFRYRAGVAPYDDADRDRVLSFQVDAVQKKSAALALDLQQTPADSKALPEVSDFPSYVTNRAKNQADWHRGKIAEHVQAEVRAWQGFVFELVRREGASRRTTARFASLGVTLRDVVVVDDPASSARIAGRAVGGEHCDDGIS